MNDVNVQELRQVYETDNKAKALFDTLAERQRGRQDSSTPRMQRVLKDKGIDMSSKELSDFYMRMQKAGVGRCVSGRNGRVSRFIWGFHLKSVAQAAKGQLDSDHKLEEAPKAKSKLPNVAVSALQKTSPSQSKHSVIQVTDRKITIRKAGFEIDFPIDMTPADWKDAAVLLNNIG